MAKTMARKSRSKSSNRNSLWIIGGVVAALALVLVLVVVNQTATTRTTTPPSALNAGRILGDANAPVEIDLYSDFQCPICLRAERAIRDLAAQYIDTGKVKVVYHNFAFIGPESIAAAQAAECANDQGKFWEYATNLFDHQTGENVGAFNTTNLKQFAADLGLDTTTFNACVDSNKYATLVQQEKAEGEARGVRATPTFFINGQMVEGLLPTAQFTALLDSLLAKTTPTP